MNIGIVSKRYAKALYEFAHQNGNDKAVYQEMQLLAHCYWEIKVLRPSLENPLLPKEEKVTLLCQAAGGEKVSNEYKRFVCLVLDERREKLMQFIAHSFIDLYREKNHINIGKLTTATPVQEETIARMKETVAKGTQGTVEFETHIDPSLLGGFVFEINFNRLNASIAHQIAIVREQFIEKNSRIV